MQPKLLKHSTTATQECLSEGPFIGAGSASESFQRYYSFTYTNTAEYKFNIDSHNVTLLGGQESIISKDQSFGVRVNGLTDTRPYVAECRCYYRKASHSKSETVFNSYFATLSYNYDEKYFFDASYRRDGSSLFGLNNNGVTSGL